MTPEQKELLEKITAKGKQHFIWVNGVLKWGLPMGILLIIYFHLYQ